MARRPEPTYYETLAVFTAAAAAHRINGGEYVKSGAVVLDGEGGVLPHPKKPNRDILLQVLTGEVQAAPEDAQVAEQIMTFYKGFTFKMLAGKVLSEFDQKGLQLAGAEKVSTLDIPLITAMPSCWARAVSRQSVDDRLADCDRGWIGAVGQKVAVDCEVVRCVYSIQWNTYYVTAITDGNNAIFYSSRSAVEVGSRIKVAGKVKSHRDGFQTQLNYTKRI